MKITDLECGLFIEDLGQIQGGKSDFMMPPPRGEVTSLAIGEESGIEPGFPFDSVNDLEGRIESRLSELLEKLTPPDMKEFY
jgi:hypothetical protein